ncbi:bifunctional riboflavin kinase/FAD synthetase [Schlesneria paludicola]|uniref:bifunctional riboflavin kinase/FAD synthetase n=1 Tax=Schlesneria paludicola TaxID=360056 RepID=UPI00029A1A42|nr:bifunctional riboflavin kinase/FAD synthetase [Schlesneria paludicola]
MTVLHGFESPASYRDGFVSIGNFDGVHCGHQSMLSTLVARARAQQVPAVALTFDPHPIELLRPDAIPPRLTTIEHRAELLQKFGVDCVIVLPTTPRFLTMTAEDFFHTIIRTELQARGLVEGPNFFFGRNRAGSITVLRQFCTAHQLTLDVIQPVIVDQQLVSSSVIRSLIDAGDITESVGLLGHPYRLTGKVGHGAERGRTLGFPTANLVDCANLIPGHGVYVAVTMVGGIQYPAAVNIGPNPTFGESAKKVEVHLLDYTGNLYDQTLNVDFVSRLRDVKKFPSVRDLVEQLQRDVAAVRSVVSTSGRQ